MQDGWVRRCVRVRRVWVRGLIVLGVIGAVVGLTVAKYVTDDTLRNDVYIERKTSGITAFDAQVSSYTRS